jgi:hypothetical protein
MHLKDFLEPPSGAKTSVGEFADRIGKNHSTVWRWAEGLRMPDREGLELLLKHTDGKVTATDMFAGLKPSERDGAAA